MTKFLHGIFFSPPMAIARLGSSPTPQDAFEWEQSDSPYGGSATTIRPAMSFDVKGDGSLSVRMPETVRFKDDDGSVRPVAPFFELWAWIQEGGSAPVETPLTIGLLKELGAGVDHMKWTVTAANNKAWQRTGAPNCRYEAKIELAGDDYARHALDAISPVSSGQTPLVAADRPICLGYVQLIRPKSRPLGSHDEGADGPDLDVIRLRFTPGRGYCFAPPDAIVGVSSPLEPGDMAAPQSLYGEIHEIVPPAHRILNGGTEWSKFVMDSMTFPHGTPIDAYDGANVGTSTSWGVVDDSCDAIIDVRLVMNGESFTAQGRVFAGPQDFAPDRRNFHSIVDDLEDRELPRPEVSVADLDERWPEIVDLFRRIFETASLFNLDMQRAWGTSVNAYRLSINDVTSDDWDDHTAPRIGPNTMTAVDTPFADKTPALIPDQAASVFSEPLGSSGLPYTEIVDMIHRSLADETALESFLRRRPDRVRELIRPPLARLIDLPERPGVSNDTTVRDPRTLRDRLYDMRMPPFMRDTMGYPLALTHRQYETLLQVLDALEQGNLDSKDGQ